MSSTKHQPSVSTDAHQHNKHHPVNNNINGQTSLQHYVHSSFTFAINEEHLRFFILRLLVLLCLVITTISIGYGSFVVLSRLQNDAQKEQYYSVARKIESSTVLSVQSRKDALLLTSGLALHFCPNVTNWPNCAIPYHLFDTVSSPLHRISMMRSISTAPIVQPSQLAEFEAFNYDYYVKDGHYPSG